MSTPASRSPEHVKVFANADAAEIWFEERRRLIVYCPP